MAQKNVGSHDLSAKGTFAVLVGPREILACSVCQINLEDLSHIAQEFVFHFCSPPQISQPLRCLIERRSTVSSRQSMTAIFPS